MPIHIFCSRTKFRDYVAEYQAFLGEKGKIISSPLAPQEGLILRLTFQRKTLYAKYQVNH